MRKTTNKINLNLMQKDYDSIPWLCKFYWNIFLKIKINISLIIKKKIFLKII